MILYELLKENLPHLLYCPNGVDIELFKPSLNKKYDPSCIKVGWIGKERGPKNYSVIKEVEQILKTLGGFETYFIKIEKESKRGPFSFKQMKEFYEKIDFYLCASWNEGTPNPALEAGACGVPVVSTCVGNMRELLKPGNNGFYVNPTVESIVNCFRSIQKITPEEYEKMSYTIRTSIVQNWTWSHQMVYFREALNRLVL